MTDGMTETFCEETVLPPGSGSAGTSVEARRQCRGRGSAGASGIGEAKDLDKDAKVLSPRRRHGIQERQNTLY